MDGLYTPNNKEVYVSDDDMDNFDILSCDSQPGHIILGGPQAPGAQGGKAMYVVAFRQISSGDKLCSAPQEPPCPAPELQQPANDAIAWQRTVAFDWADLSCAHQGYEIRVKTVPDMNSGGALVLSAKTTDSSYTASLDPKWDNQDLYWSVRADKAPGGAEWSPSRRFHITPNLPPTVSLDLANAMPVTSDGQAVWSNTLDWTFSGTASDADGTVTSVQVVCRGFACPLTSAAAEGTTAWTYTAGGLTGRNEFTFTAVDEKGARSNATDRDSVVLYIDASPPTTWVALDGVADDSQWPEWHTQPVTVQLTAMDEGSGAGADMARSGVSALHYQLDGAGWQSTATGMATIEIGTDGEHVLDYYSVDAVGNAEEQRSLAIKVDQTPPSPPQNVVEPHGVSNNVWQGYDNLPVFRWDAGTDASGIWGYQFYFGLDPTGVGYTTIAADAPLEYAPFLDGVRTETYYLRGRTRDTAGNWSGWADLFTFRYDGTPPENPSEITQIDGVANDTWQKTSNRARLYVAACGRPRLRRGWLPHLLGTGSKRNRHGLNSGGRVSRGRRSALPTVHVPDT